MANQLAILVEQQTTFTSTLDILDYGPIETAKNTPKAPRIRMIRTQRSETMQVGQLT